MANEKNLIPFDERTENEQREIARQGGIASGIARREKKTVQKILEDYLDLGITKNKTLEALARKAGISTDGSIKDLVTAVCVLNTLKNGELKDLELMMKLLGEKPEEEQSSQLEVRIIDDI